MGVTKTELRQVVTKHDDVKLELLRLRAALLPEERMTAGERKLIEPGRRDIEKGHYDFRSPSKRTRCVDLLFEVIVSNRARKSLRHMPEHYVRRVLLVLEALTQNPAPAPQYDVKKLAGSRDTHRIRIGEICIEYKVDWELKRVAVLAVEFRGRAYT
jgi:mRNA-degrading endonuclease RelE of RelBE toxin-antitoxin system